MNAEFDAAFIRVRPSEFETRFKAESLVAREVSPSDLRKADEIFEEYIGKTLQIDSRPSDAIALALRTRSPIFVEESVIDGASHVDSAHGSSDVGRLRKWLEGLGDEELGKYKM